MTSEVVHESIAARRRRIGLSSNAVAALLGVTKFMYSRWERGAEPLPPLRAEQLALILSEYEEAGARFEQWRDNDAAFKAEAADNAARRVGVPSERRAGLLANAGLLAGGLSQRGVDPLLPARPALLEVI